MSKRKNTQQLGNISAEVLAELTAEAVAEATAEAEQSAEQTEEQSAEAEQSADFVLATDKELAELKAVAKSFIIREEHFHLMIEKSADLQSTQGEGTDDSVLIGRYGYGSNGKGELVSVWCRRKKSDRKATLLSADSTQKKEKHAFPRDYGVRFSQDDFAMFNNITECSKLIQSAYNEHTEQKHNEPRFSFDTLSSATAFLAQLYNAYEKHTAEQTAEEQKSTEAEEQKQTEEQTTKQKSRSRKEQKQKA